MAGAERMQPCSRLDAHPDLHTMMKSRWRRWNDKAVLHLDYANFKADLQALRAEVSVADAEIQREPKGTVLVHANADAPVQHGRGSARLAHAWRVGER